MAVGRNDKRFHWRIHRFMNHAHQLAFWGWGVVDAKFISSGKKAFATIQIASCQENETATRVHGADRFRYFESAVIPDIVG
jgi:hypothetical protein